MRVRVNNVNPLELDFVDTDRNNASKLLGFAVVRSIQDFLGVVKEHADRWKCNVLSWSPMLGETFMYIDKKEFCRLLNMFTFRKVIWIEDFCERGGSKNGL